MAMATTMTIPFGMLFEEPTRYSGVSLAPVYDDRRDISLVHNEMGRLVPYVQFAEGGTQTTTRIKKEETDQDPSSRPPRGTETCTKTRTESTEIDY